jgi:hypothetical protein
MNLVRGLRAFVRIFCAEMRAKRKGTTEPARPAPVPKPTEETSDDEESADVLVQIIDSNQASDPQREESYRRDWYETLRRHVQRKHESRAGCPVCLGLMRDHLGEMMREREQEK